MSFTKALLSVSILLLFNSIGFSQDIIFFKDGTKDSIRVVYIDNVHITFKLLSDLSKKDYYIKKIEVDSIKFENGKTRSFKNEKELDYTELIKKRRNILTMNVFGLALTNLHVGYENITPNGMFGVKFNFIGTVLVDFLDVGVHALGVDFNYYPRGQGKFRYFLGPSIRAGIFDENIAFTSVLFNNGVAYSAKSGFYLGGQLGLGPGIFRHEGIYPYGFIMLNIGKRF